METIAVRNRADQTPISERTTRIRAVWSYHVRLGARHEDMGLSAYWRTPATNFESVPFKGSSQRFHHYEGAAMGSALGKNQAQSMEEVILRNLKSVSDNLTPSEFFRPFHVNVS